MTEGGRIREESRTYFARYRDGSGLVVEVPTGCRDKQAAEAVLADLERTAQRVKAGVVTTAELKTADHGRTPIGTHVDAYKVHLAALQVSRKHEAETIRRLNRVLIECRFSTLADLDR